MLRRDEKVLLHSPTLGSSREFYAPHAAALLALVERATLKTWELPADSPYHYEDGEIRRKPSPKAPKRKRGQ